MNIELTEADRELLLDLIEEAEERAIQSMDHAETRSFKDILRARLELLGSIEAKVRGRDAAA
jgi:hypothetical protein